MYPSIIQHPSPNHSPRGKHSVEYIILHHTGTALGRETDAQRRADLKDLKWLTDPTSKVSAHYLIGHAGQVMQLVDEARSAWHAGACPGFPSLNERSIGIELCHPGTHTLPFTEAQYLSLIPLLRDLVTRYDILPHRLCGHRDVAPKRKQDPADSFDWLRVRKEVYR